MDNTKVLMLLLLDVLMVLRLYEEMSIFLETYKKY